MTPEASNQANEHIGTHDELVLPDVVPLLHPEHAGRFLRWLNEQWIQWHYFSRGIAGTGVEWYLFFVGVGTQNKRLSIVLLCFLMVTVEEKYSEQPFFTNMVKYVMHAIDPEAAEIIFAEKKVTADPIGKAAALATEDATQTFTDSAEYRLLKTEIEADVSRQIRRQAYVAAGMKEDVVALDAEIVEARQARAAKREVKEAAALEEPTVVEHQQGAGMIAPAEEGLDPEPVAVPVEEVLVEPAEDVQPEKKGKAERRRKKPELPFELPPLPKP